MRNATLVSSTTGAGGGDPKAPQKEKKEKEKKVWVQEGLGPLPAASALAAAAEGCQGYGSGDSGAGGDWSSRPVVEYPLSVCAPALLPFAARWVRQEKNTTRMPLDLTPPFALVCAPRRGSGLLLNAAISAALVKARLLGCDAEALAPPSAPLRRALHPWPLLYQKVCLPSVCLPSVCLPSVCLPSVWCLATGPAAPARFTVLCYTSGFGLAWPACLLDLPA